MQHSTEGSIRSALVTGGAGFIGSHLADRLRDTGVAVKTVDDLREISLAPVDGELMRKNVLDLTPDDLAGVDAVFHLASDKSVPLSFERPLQYIENIECTIHLLRICARANIPKIYIASTCEVYGTAEHLPTEESQPFAPMSPYAATKVAMEMVTRAYQQATASGTDITVLRFFNIYGPRQRPDNVVSGFCLGALTDGLLPVDGEGTQRRDFTYIDDLIDQIVQLPGLARSPAVLNLGSGASTSVLEIAAIVRDLSPDSTVAWMPARRNDPQEFRAGTGLRKSLLQQRTPPVVLSDGIARTLNWWRESGAIERISSAKQDAPRNAHLENMARG
ncbi:NAD-dependent epimerase/dehydratase family protein [Streptomyces flaveus]|uniref:NAD-dependent epimerase/dehydratase family protein n=1 Tax=Streptomyces flaveus TaxID=66370 RepID=UPI00331A640E